MIFLLKMLCKCLIIYLNYDLSILLYFNKMFNRIKSRNYSNVTLNICSLNGPKQSKTAIYITPKRQNKHIEIISGKFNYLRLTPPEIKRHKAPTVSLPQAVNVYKTVLKQSIGLRHCTIYVQQLKCFMAAKLKH